MRERPASVLTAILLSLLSSSLPAQSGGSSLTTDVTPAAPATSPIRQLESPPNVFGTVAVPFGTTSMSARWTRATTLQAVEPALSRLVSQAHHGNAQYVAKFVNAAINRGIRNPSVSKCTDDGYWASAGESLAKGFGDCVDIAVAKMTALRSLGFAARDLFLISGRRPAGGIEAGLLLRIGSQFFLLTPNSDRLAESHDEGTFIPIVTYGTAMTWAHGVPVGTPRLLRSKTTARSGDARETRASATPE